MRCVSFAAGRGPACGRVLWAAVALLWLHSCSSESASGAPAVAASVSNAAAVVENPVSNTAFTVADIVSNTAPGAAASVRDSAPEAADSVREPAPMAGTQRGLAEEPLEREDATDGERELVTGLNGFALQMLMSASPKDNAVHSPADVSGLFALLSAGASGATREELWKAFRFVDRSEAYITGWVKGVFDQQGPGCDLSRTLGFYPQTGHALGEEFSRLMDQNGATLEELNLIRDPVGSARTINQGIRRRTNGMIDEIITPDDLKGFPVLVATSAVLFDGRWAVPFAKDRTEVRDFWSVGGRDYRVPFMNDRRHVRFHRAQDAAVLELPYSCEGLSLLLVLPEDRQAAARRGRGGPTALGLGGLGIKGQAAAVQEPTAEVEPTEARLSAFVATLTPELIEGWVGALRSTEVSISIPKFRISQRWDLVELLKTMGVEKAFIAGEADFNKMVPGVGAHLSRARHMAVFSVDEERTEAAAATSVVFGNRGSSISTHETFHADRPFLFFLRDTRTGLILFAGKVVDPS